MSRSAGERAHRNPGRVSSGGRAAHPARRLRAAAPALLLTLLALPVPSPAFAQAVGASSAPVLTAPVEDSLIRLQEGWLQWTTALYSNDSERARGVVENLVETTQRLGMRGLPDLAGGALVQAVDAARKGESSRAALALEAAERLDPGRPETAFAAAEVARLSGSWAEMVAAEGRGYARLPSAGLERKLALYDLLLWGVASLLLACGLFAVLAMAVRGPALVRDLGRAVSGRLGGVPAAVAGLVVAAVLLWPLVLPSGLLWLVLYWTLLLWGYLGLPERMVLVFGWLVVAITPLLVAEIGDRVAFSLSPPVRAMESAARGSLYGGLFTDLGVLPAALPENPAVDHFLADLHVRFGQWEGARRRYERVLAKEPQNLPALVNLGAYYFNREDFGNAVAYLRQATAVPGGDSTERAAAYFDLSQAYSQSYLFDEQRAAHLEARRIDNDQVSRWLRGPGRQQIVTVEGGIDRVDEMERALRAKRSAQDGVSPALAMLRRARPAILVLVLAAAAIAIHAAIRSRGGSRRAGVPPAEHGGGWWSAVLVPGLPSLHRGRGARALGALLLVVAPALVFVAGSGRLGFDLPWRHDPGGWFLPAIAILVLAAVLAVRVVRAAREAGRARASGA